MSQQINMLMLKTLRAANIARLPQFKNKHGLAAHSKPDGSDWDAARWLQAVVGELGEYANFRKKFDRGDITLEEFKEHAAKELADVLTYLDLLALRCLDVDGQPGEGIDLAQATVDKFNEVSLRVDSTVRIRRHGETWFHLGNERCEHGWKAGHCPYRDCPAYD